ncbi:MAG: RteC domain-containing protein [Bacteroidales bacterium]|nr:RteC domain-containing protein [Bacteroidales bacterium]
MLTILDKALLFVTEQIDIVKWQTYFKCPYANNTEERLYWAGTIVELVELIYALYEMECFEKISLKKLFNIVGKLFNVEIKDYSRVFTDIRNRTTKERLKFLYSLIRVLDRRMEKDDLKPPRK